MGREENRRRQERGDAGTKVIEVERGEGGIAGCTICCALIPNSKGNKAESRYNEKGSNDQSYQKGLAVHKIYLGLIKWGWMWRVFTFLSSGMCVCI